MGGSVYSGDRNIHDISASLFLSVAQILRLANSNCFPSSHLLPDLVLNALI